MNKFAKHYLAKLGADIDRITTPTGGGGVRVYGMERGGFKPAVLPVPARSSVIELHGGDTVNSAGANMGYALSYAPDWKNPQKTWPLPPRHIASNNPDVVDGGNGAALRKSLKDTDSVWSHACNAEGSGCPEFYERMAGHPLKEVSMAPPGAVGANIYNQSPYLAKTRYGEVSPTGVLYSPVHRYLKDSTGKWVDKGINPDGRTATKDDAKLTGALSGVAGATTGIASGSLRAAAPAALSGALKSVGPVGLGIQGIGEVRETIAQGGMKNHLDKMDLINEDSGYSYGQKVLSNLARPIGSIMGPARSLVDSARSYMSGPYVRRSSVPVSNPLQTNIPRQSKPGLLSFTNR